MILKTKYPSMIQQSSLPVYRQAIGKTFINAFNGMQFFFKTERNGKVQAAVSIFVLLAGFYLKISSVEWIIVVICVAVVIALEMVNTALEHLCNMIQSEYHTVIKIIKDVAAGAVLFVSIISILVGAIIFLPKILSLL